MCSGYTKSIYQPIYLAVCLSVCLSVLLMNKASTNIQQFNLFFDKAKRKVCSCYTKFKNGIQSAVVSQTVYSDGVWMDIEA